MLGALVNEKSELLRLINQALLSDLTSRRECFKTLALAFIANVGNAETAETLANNVAKILMDKTATTYLLKKSALCLLHLFRKNRDAVQPDSWNERLVTLLNHRDGGVLTSVMSLINGFASAEPDTFAQLIPIVCRLVHRVVTEKYITGDYTYDHIPAPWLLVKSFQFLQHYSSIPTQEAMNYLLFVLRRIINTDSRAYLYVDQRTQQIHRHNAMLAVLFESIYLTTQLRLELPLIQRCIRHVRAFVKICDPDIRYISLEAVQRLCPLDPTTTGDDPEFVKQIEEMLTYPDISLRRRAMDVLFELCSSNNSKSVVEKLLSYLQEAEMELREELVCLDFACFSFLHLSFVASSLFHSRRAGAEDCYSC